MSPYNLTTFRLRFLAAAVAILWTPCTALAQTGTAMPERETVGSDIILGTAIDEKIEDPYAEDEAFFNAAVEAATKANLEAEAALRNNTNSTRQQEIADAPATSPPLVKPTTSRPEPILDPPSPKSEEAKRQNDAPKKATETATIPAPKMASPMQPPPKKAEVAEAMPTLKETTISEIPSATPPKIEADTRPKHIVSLDAEECISASKYSDLLKKIGLIEAEKEKLRKLASASVPLSPTLEAIRECAGENRKIRNLETQIEILSKENESLKKRAEIADTSLSSDGDAMDAALQELNELVNDDSGN